MRPQLEEDRCRRKEFNRFEEKRILLKVKVKNRGLSDSERLEALEALRNFSRNSSAIRVRNRCSLTGRSRGVLTKYKMSRVMFRKLVMSGKLAGFKKGSW